MRRWLLTAFVLYGLLAGCGRPVQTIRVELNEYQILPQVMEVKVGALVRLEVVNWGREPHDLVVEGIDDAATYRLQPYRYEIVEFQAPARPGTYRVICTVPGHVAHGQVGQFLVTR